MLKSTTYQLIISKEYARFFDHLLQKKKIDFTKSKGIANNTFEGTSNDAKEENFFIYSLLNINPNVIFQIGLEVGKNGNA